jgi:hypothetical protein
MGRTKNYQSWMILFLVVLLTSCSTPTVNPTRTSFPRWMVYQQALSKAIVNTHDGLCEWEILGTSGNEVYVWALCKVRELIGSAGSVPAVIKLGENGEIEKVTIPRDGNFYPKDVQALFPAEIQEKVFHSDFNGSEAEKHIDERLKSNGPPLIVISGTLLP